MKCPFERRIKVMMYSHIYHGMIQQEMNIPCGHCHVCQEKRQKEWAFRLEIEYEKADAVEFVTLTYDSEFVPQNEKGELVLDPSHITNFFKRLRERLVYDQYKRYCRMAKDEGFSFVATQSEWRKIYAEFIPRLKYFLVGEYGPNGTRRPHYHFLLFGYNVFSPAIESAVRHSWNYGFIKQSSAGRGSINYVSGYINKSCCPPSDSVVPVFTRCSANIGIDFIDSTVFASALREERRYIWRTFFDRKSNRTISYKFPLPRYYFRKLGCILSREQYLELVDGIIPVPQSINNGTYLLTQGSLTLENVEHSLPYDYILHCREKYNRLVQSKSSLPRNKQYKLSFQSWLLSSIPSRLKRPRVTRLTSLTQTTTQMTLDVDRFHSLRKSSLATYLKVRRNHLCASPLSYHLLSAELTSLSTFSLFQQELLTMVGRNSLPDIIKNRAARVRHSLSLCRTL